LFIALTVVSSLLVVYLIVLLLRVTLAWFFPQTYGRAWEILRAVTDPYLNLFRGIRFLRGNVFDFSPVAALLVLILAINLVTQLANFGRITVGFFLASLLSAAWSGVGFLLVFFAIVGVIRAIPMLFPGAGGSAIWRVADLMIRPVVAWVTRVLQFPARLEYPGQLLVTVIALLAVWAVGKWGVIPQIYYLVTLLPF
jgi:YggT family protein